MIKLGKGTIWIQEQFEKYDYRAESKYILYGLYNLFRQDAQSDMPLDSYKRKVRKIYYNHTSKIDDTQPSVQKEESGNTAVYSYKGSRITTVGQLLDFCNVSKDDWNIDRQLINKWESPRKNQEIDLTWTDGKKSGTEKDHGNMRVEPLFQIKVWLTKKVLDNCSLPELKQVNIKLNSKLKKEKLVSKKPVHSVIVLADAQMGFSRDFKTGKLFPLHDRRVFSIALQVIKAEQPEIIILNGDFFDFAELSDKFLNSPEFYYSIQPALIEFAWWMKEIRMKSPNSRIIYLAGNHEDRLQKNIIKHSAFAHGLKSVDRLDDPDVLSIQNLAGLESLGVEWLGGYKHHSGFWLNDNTQITHGTVASGKSGLTVKNIIRDATHSQIVGHIHKFESAEKVIEEGGRRKEIQVWAFGTMCRVDGMVPAHSGFVNWQQGFGIIDIIPNNPEIGVSIYPVKVNNGISIYSQEILYSEEVSQQIAEDTGWDTLDISNVEENVDNLYFK